MGIIIVFFVLFVFSAVASFVFRNSRAIVPLLFVAYITGSCTVFSTVNYGFSVSPGVYAVEGVDLEPGRDEAFCLRLRLLDSGETNFVFGVTQHMIPKLDLDACLQNGGRCGCLEIEREFWFADNTYRPNSCMCQIPEN